MELCKCSVKVVTNKGQSLCPKCDAREYYFYILDAYGPRDCASRMNSNRVVVSGRNLLKT